MITGFSFHILLFLNILGLVLSGDTCFERSNNVEQGSTIYCENGCCQGDNPCCSNGDGDLSTSSYLVMGLVIGLFIIILFCFCIFCTTKQKTRKNKAVYQRPDDALGENNYNNLSEISSVSGQIMTNPTFEDQPPMCELSTSSYTGAEHDVSFQSTY